LDLFSQIKGNKDANNAGISKGALSKSIKLHANPAPKKLN